jgi:hypothetical protein
VIISGDDAILHLQGCHRTSLRMTRKGAPLDSGASFL